MDRGQVEASPGRTRAFVGLRPPAEILEALAGHLADCASVAPGFRWVAATGLHLTLRFLGNLEVEQLAAVRRELALVAGEPFELRLGGHGSFGSRAAPRVAWLAVAAGAPQAGRLAALVEAAVTSAGLDPEARPYRPHLTLGRARPGMPGPLPRLPPPPPLAGWRVAEFVLYRSILGGRAPAEYVPLETYRLA